MRTLFAMTVLSLLPNAHSNHVHDEIVVKVQKPIVQLALLLDTSNSMDGLINQAKSQLWKIVNEFATAKRHGLTPELHVSLYEYGNNNLPAQEGFIRQVLPFTTDLDKLSEKLFSLRTNGGNEFCGQVIQSALNELTWNGSANNLKVIFIAGNEPFTQGTTDYKDVCKAAAIRNITINTIHCGNYDQGVQGMWQDGAVRGEGKFFCINQDLPVTMVAAPQDPRILELNLRLNTTYLPYGATGLQSQERQVAQDTNAASCDSSILAQRVATKGSTNYCNSTWDLVDACKEKKVKIEEIKEEELPAEMKKMSIEERKVFVIKKSEEREQIRVEISKLSEERNKFVAEKEKELSKDGTSLDQALIQAIRELAMKKGYEFKK